MEKNLSFRVIAKETGVSKTPVCQRVKEYLASGKIFATQRGPPKAAAPKSMNALFGLIEVSMKGKQRWGTNNVLLTVHPQTHGTSA